jgi:hypothetical protein
LGQSEGTESRLYHYSQAHDVSFRSQEDRCRTESKMGEVEEAAEGGLNASVDEPLLLSYYNFAYSALARIRMGMSGSASFQRVRKPWMASLLRQPDLAH